MRDEAPIGGRDELKKRPVLHSKLTILEIIIADVRLLPGTAILDRPGWWSANMSSVYTGLGCRGWERSGGYLRLLVLPLIQRNQCILYNYFVENQYL